MATYRERVNSSMVKMPNMTLIQYQRPSGALWYTENVDYSAYRGTYKDISDYVTPGYRSLVKKGSVISNPCVRQYSKIVQDQSSCYGSVHHNGTSVWYDATISGMALARLAGQIAPTYASGWVDLFKPYGSTSLPTLSVLSNKAAVDALGKVRPPEMQTLVTLAELDKSLKLIGDTAKKLAAALAAMKSGKPSSVIAAALGVPPARRQPSPVHYTTWNDNGTPNYSIRKNKADGKTVTKVKKFYGHRPRKSKDSPVPISALMQEWLAWRYGWGPMVMDIVSALKALNKARDNRRFMVRGFASAETSFASDRNVPNTHGTVTLRVDVSHSRNVRAFVLYEVEPGLGALINDFGVLDFPSSAWELIPFSFVIDWFISVGDWVKALTPKIGVNILASGVSMTENITVARKATAWSAVNTPGSWDFSAIVGHSDSGEGSRYERTNYISLPSFPPVDVKINVKRAIDSIALLSNLRSRK